MTNIKKKKLSKLSLYILSFILPSTILFSVYLSQNIYWNSEISPLLGDGFHQYVIFDIALRNILHGDGSIFYTFTSGLGLNFYALSSYYLGSFFSPFVYFFNLNNMPDAVYLFTFCKFGLTGLTSFYSLKHIYQKIPSFLTLSLSTSYALMSFATSQIEIATWQDVFILIPLILLGFERLLKKKGKTLYFISLSLLFIQNYYFGYMMSLFLILWYFIYLSWNFKATIQRFFDFVFISLFSAATSMLMLLPTILDLRTHGEQFSKIEHFWNPDSWYLDIFAKNFVGSFDTTKYGSIPMIYIGLFPLLLAFIFFTLKSIKFHVKLSYLLLIGILIASFYIQPLDLFWQGMHAPNMFLHRYSWIFSIVILSMASETLNRISEVKLVHFLSGFIVLSSGFLATALFDKHYDFLSLVNYTLTLEFLVAYLLLSLVFIKKLISKKIFTLSILFFVTFEVSLNTFYQIEGIAQEWVFASRSSYSKNIKDVDNLVNGIKKESSSFYRAEFLDPQTGNDTMKYNVNGISQFSSVRNTTTSSTLDKLGFYSAGTNLNLRYQNNSILMDSIFGIKYNIAEIDPQKYQFDNIKNSGKFGLYENKNATGLGILTNEVYQDIQFDNLTLDNQTKFINRLSGQHLKYYYRLEAEANQDVSIMSNRHTANAKEGDTVAHASYTLTIPANHQVYLTIPGLTFTNENTKEVNITVNNITSRYKTSNVFPFFNVGNFPSETTVTIDVSFPENSQVSYDKPEFYAVNLENFQLAMSHINSKDIETKVEGNTVLTSYHSQNDASILYTIPYDKGWTATQNGKNITIKKAQNGFMKVDIKKGDGSIKLQFIPHGFKAGVIISILGIVAFLLYNHLTSKNRKTSNDLRE